MLSYNFIRKHITAISIIIYLILFLIVVYIKPNFIYNKDGGLREFGIGRSKKTIIPIWLFALLISILSYFTVFFYIESPKLNFE